MGPFAKILAAAILVVLSAAPGVCAETIPISGLPRAASPLSGSELFPLVQGGVTRRIAASEFFASVPKPSFDDLTGWRNGTIGIGSAPAFTPTPLTIGGSFAGGADPDDPSIYLKRTLTGAGNSHAISDYTVFNRPAGNYGGFDFRVSTTGTADHDHIHGFQYRPEFSSSGYMETALAFSAAGGSIHAGTLNFFKGMEVFSLGLDGGAVVNNEIGIDIHPFVNAPAAARIAIQVRKRTAIDKGDPSYFGGDIRIDSSTKKDGSNPYGAFGVTGDIVVVGSINTVWSSTASEPSLNLSSHAAFPRVALSDDTTGTWNIWPDHASTDFRIALNADTAGVRISTSYNMSGVNDLTAGGSITGTQVNGGNLKATNYIGWGSFNESFIANTTTHQLVGYVNNAAWLSVDSSRNVSFPAYTTAGVLTNDTAGLVATIAGFTGTKTVRAAGGGSDCTLIYNKGVLTGGSC